MAKHRSDHAAAAVGSLRPAARRHPAPEGLADRGLGGTPNGQDALASCKPVYGRKYAMIRLAESFLIDTRSSSVIPSSTSCFHCHFAPMMRLLEADENRPARPRNSRWNTAVDGIADAIAPLLPMPPASTRSQH